MNKNILITGASRGLGKGLVAEYLKNGFCVFAGIRNGKSNSLAELKEQYGDFLHVIEMDIGDTESVKKASRELGRFTASLDVIINNAGVHADDSLSVLEEINVDNCMETYNINTLGALRVAAEFVKFLDGSGLGILANISSEAGSISNCKREKEFDYCMSKAALNMQSVLLQNYLKARNIKVLAIHPGWFRSDMGGPNAHLAVSEAAEGVTKIIEEFGKNLNGPVYVDNLGSEMPY